MKMQGKFIRYKGTVPAGGKALGSDALPAAGVRPTGDNVVSLPMKSQSGFPLKGLLVGCVYTAGGGSPTTVPVNVYAWDEATQALVLVGAQQSITVGTPTAPAQATSWTPITLIDPAMTLSNAQEGNSGAALYFIVPADNTQPNGTYQFYVGGTM